MEKNDRRQKERKDKIFYARKLRQRLTPEEITLWHCLRAKRFHNLKFRRQVPIGSFIVDFVCIQLHLIIEIDGPIHDQQKEYDVAREDYLHLMGYKVLRFTNDQIQNHLVSVLANISEETKQHTFPSPLQR